MMKMDIRNLVQRISDFANDYDPFLGLTEEETKQSNRITAGWLRDGRTEDIEDWLSGCMSELETEDDLYVQASDILKEVRQYATG